jgi:asparagine synthase (glutamine-hydrolysing)
MCGIWTVLGNDEQTKILQKDFFNILHRGPDISVYQKIDLYSDKEKKQTLQIGFHRLSIIDKTSDSHQPFMVTKGDSTFLLVCNGEIYNYREIREKYNLDEKKKSDCFVLLQLFLKYHDNLDFFYKLFEREIRGEFAFVLYEIKEKRILQKIIGRDMIGIRPLYCSIDYNVICSELKGISKYPNQIIEFPPGTIWNNQKIHNFKWVYNVIPKQLSDENHLQNIRDCVINSIKIRLQSDRPIAFLLSGGVDSSLVCALSSKLLNQQIHTFCIGFKNEGTDFEYARMVAEKINSIHTEIYMTHQEAIDVIPNVIDCVETWDTTTIRASVGQYLACKYISENTDFKVLLVGEGPDEICSSYLFNWNCPNEHELHETAKEYVKNIHYYDVKRVDKCISKYGLEARVPLLDPLFIEKYWQIPSIYRHPKNKGIEKWWLRKAFESMDLLPEKVLWRKKEAFSDGLSSKKNSWHKILQKNYNGNEISNYISIFNSLFPQRQNLIPAYWQPKWTGKHQSYNDPSARTLNL